MKILGLIPCYMLPNNRDINKACMLKFKTYYNCDKIIVLSQGFEQDDYLDGFEYIGNYPEGVGFVKARNELLKYFYESDYDYALWMDANGWFSKTSYNSVVTITNALKNNKLELDVILSTLGIVNSSYRQDDKQREDYFERLAIVPVPKEQRWFHGLIMKNIKKYYNLELFCERDITRGVAEDVFFVQLLRRVFTTFACPDLCVTKSSSKTSTWMNNNSSYDYPEDDYDECEKMIDKLYIDLPRYLDNRRSIYIERNSDYKDLLQPFRSRRKEKTDKQNMLF